MHTIESTQSRTYIEQHIALQSEPTVCSLYCDTDINLAMSSSLRVAVGIENKGVISVPFFGKMKCLMLYPTVYFMTMSSAILGLQSAILGLQSISRHTYVHTYILFCGKKYFQYRKNVFSFCIDYF